MERLDSPVNILFLLGVKVCKQNSIKVDIVNYLLMTPADIFNKISCIGINAF